MARPADRVPPDVTRDADPTGGPLPPGPVLVEAVCVVDRVRPGFFHDTAIDKQPRPDTVAVGELGLAGDRQMDPHHGGPDAAVYVYAEEDAAYWAERLGRGVPPGLFGENVRTRGLDVTGARLGERWRLGEVVLEVRKPRTPCQNLALRVGVDDFHLDFNRSGRVGALCRVVETGSLASGDAGRVLFRPEHDVTVRDCATGMDPAAARRMLASGVALTSAVRSRARRAAARP